MAATLKVFCAGAVKSPVMKLAQAFERNTGCKLDFTFGAVGGLQAKASAGEPADVLILARPALDGLAPRVVCAETIVDLGSVGVGIAVHGSAPAPDVSTPEALRVALMAAKSLTYGDPAKGDSSGIHFAAVVDRLGIAGELRSKTVLAPLGLAVAQLVESGEVEMGATQATVILAHEGIRLAGLLPPSLQHLTTYSAAVTVGTSAADAAQRFVGCFTTSAAKSTFDKAGLRQPS